MRKYRTKDGVYRVYSPARRDEWGALVKREREERELTKKDLAHLSCLDPSYISLIELHGCVPRLQTIERIATALGIEPAVAFKAAGYGVTSLPT